MAMPPHPSPKRVLPGINPAAERPEAAKRGTPPIRPERPAPDRSGTVFKPRAKRPDAPEEHTTPIRRPVTAASRAENGRLVEALTRTTNPGYVPDYIVEALSRGDEQTIADVTDLFAQYAARDQSGARRLAWEVQRRAQDVGAVRRTLGQKAEIYDDSQSGTNIEAWRQATGEDIEPAFFPLIPAAIAAGHIGLRLAPHVLPRVLQGAGLATIAAGAASNLAKTPIPKKGRGETLEMDQAEPLPPDPGLVPSELTPEEKGEVETFPAERVEAPQFPGGAEPIDPDDFIEIFPPLDEKYRGMIILESKGKEPTRVLNRKILDVTTAANKEAGTRTRHVAGSRDEYGNEIKEQYFPNRETGGVLGSSRADATIVSDASNRQLHINTTDTLVDRETLSKRENDQAERLYMNMKTGRMILSLGKIRPGETVDEEKLKNLLIPILKELDKKIPQPKTKKYLNEQGRWVAIKIFKPTKRK